MARLQALLPVFAVAICSSTLPAQDQVTITAPHTTVSESFSERIGVSFGINHPNFFMRFGGGGPGGAVNPGGGIGAGTGITIPFRGNRFNGHFGIHAGQSFSRGISTVAPMLTVTNGVPGFVGSGVLTPFVTEIRPIVGGAPGFRNYGGVSTVRGRLLRGEFRLRRTPEGATDIVFPDPPARPEQPAAPARNAFQSGLKNYAK